MSYTKNEYPSKYIPTEFDNYHTKLMIDGKEIDIDLVDTSGKDEDKLRSLSFNNCHIFMLMFAVNQRDSFINCKVKWLKEITQTAPGTPFILIGTKSDIKSNVTGVPKKEIDKFVSETDLCIGYKETSAKSQSGVKDAFECAVRTVLYPNNRGNGGCCIIL